jgi:tetratricopeptide (TPR) repeat protein
MRQARVTGNAAYAARAEQRLRAALGSDPADYEARRMLGPVLLSRHKFAEAVTAAHRARAMRPDDSFNVGVIGDGLLEQGKYDDAFAAFQRMVDLRPGAGSYARVAYAQELQGRLDLALETMQRAANATSPRDAEGLAWTLTQVGDLLFRLDRVADADTQYRLAATAFPDHPFALMGRARVLAARQQDDDSIALAQTLLDRAPSMRLAAFLGDLHARNQRPSEAERFYTMAEAIGRDSGATDESLAGFLAERGRSSSEALELAERAASTRQDVNTLDALAWAYFRTGWLQAASAIADKALRTGTREKRVVLHAAAIRAALGDVDAARVLVRRAAARDPDFDVLSAARVMSLMTSSASSTAPIELRAAR